MLEDGASCSIWRRRGIPSRGAQQVPAASVVAGEEYRAPRARCGGEERHVAPGGAAPRPGASLETGNLPRTRPALSYGEASGPSSIRGQAETGDGTTFSRIRDLSPDYPSRSGKSFGPIYARGLLRQGQTAFAVLGVNASETQSSIDAALTFAILWLDLCRESSAGRSEQEDRRRKVPRRGTCSLCSRGLLGVGPRADGEPESGGGQVALVRV